MSERGKPWRNKQRGGAKTCAAILVSAAVFLCDAVFTIVFNRKGLPIWLACSFALRKHLSNLLRCLAQSTRPVRLAVYIFWRLVSFLRHCPMWLPCAVPYTRQSLGGPSTHRTPSASGSGVVTGCWTSAGKVKEPCCEFSPNRGTMLQPQDRDHAAVPLE